MYVCLYICIYIWDRKVKRKWKTKILRKNYTNIYNHSIYILSIYLPTCLSINPSICLPIYIERWRSTRKGKVKEESFINGTMSCRKKEEIIWKHRWKLLRDRRKEGQNEMEGRKVRVHVGCPQFLWKAEKIEWEDWRMRKWESKMSGTYILTFLAALGASTDFVNSAFAMLQIWMIILFQKH